MPHGYSPLTFFQRGNITDPPLEEISTAPTASFRHLTSRSPSPVMSAPGDEAPIFCDTCQRNQTLYTNLLAEFLPEEDDAEYEKYLAAYDEYKIELEERYPQVCKDCLPRVQAQIRSANHVARADNLARIMEASKTKQKTVQTWRQAFTLNVISLAMWIYIGSTLAGMLWHTAGLIMASNESVWANQTFDWDTCLSQAFLVRSVDESCVLSPYIVKWMHWAIAEEENQQPHGTNARSQTTMGHPRDSHRPPTGKPSLLAALGDQLPHHQELSVHTHVYARRTRPIYHSYMEDSSHSLRCRALFSQVHT
jgi:hypothetical protein